VSVTFEPPLTDFASASALRFKKAGMSGKSLKSRRVGLGFHFDWMAPLGELAEFSAGARMSSGLRSTTGVFGNL